MAIDTDRLVQIAAELKELDRSKEHLLAELQRIVGGIGAAAPVARQRGRPRGLGTKARAQGAAPVVPGRPRGSLNQPKAAAPGVGRKPRKGLAADIVEFLKSSGGAHTAGELVAALKRPKTKGGIASISTTLVRLAKEGRAKKDKERGYRAA